MITYKLTMMLTKHKRTFTYIYKARPDEDVQGIKESIAMWVEQSWHTPARCTKIEVIG